MKRNTTKKWKTKSSSLILLDLMIQEKCGYLSFDLNSTVGDHLTLVIVTFLFIVELMLGLEGWKPFDQSNRQEGGRLRALPLLSNPLGIVD